MIDEEEGSILEQAKVESLTDWTNPPKVSDLKSDYIEAESDQSAHTADVTRWLDMMNVTGSAAIPKKQGRSTVQPKLIRKQAEWRYAALSEPFMTTTELFDVDPVTYEDKRSAVQNALVINNQVNSKMDKTAFIDEYIRTGVDEGTVIVRVGWDFEEEEQEQPKYAYKTSTAPEHVQMLQQLSQMAQEDPERFELEVPEHIRNSLQLSMEQGVPVVAYEDGTEKVMVTTKNQPTWEVCDYQNISVDPTCFGDYEKAQFIIYSTETSLSVLKKDGKYKNLDAIPASASTISSTEFNNDNTSSFTFKDKPRQKIVMHEYWGYWDIDGSGIVKPIVAAYVGDVMIRLEENPFPDKKLPFVSVQMLPVRKSNFGQPDGELIGDNQKIIGATTRGMIDIMARSANAQQGYAKGTFDTTNRRKFIAGDDYEFNPTMNPDQAFHVHKYPELPQSAILMNQLMSSDAESLTGVRPFSQSQQGAVGSETASGVKTALDATSKRDTGILRRFVQGIIKIGRKTIAMNQQFLTEEEVVRITNSEFVTVRRDDLAGNFDLRLTISTAEEDEARAQELAFMLQTTAQSMGNEFSQIILAEIATLRRMPVLAKKISEFQPQPDPLEQERKQLEIELLKAQIEKERSIVLENQAEAELDYAKVGTENARAKDLSNTADQKNLDYLEQEAGVKHNRDLDRASQQSKAQTNTKLVEHGLNRQAAKEDKLMDTSLQSNQP
jgi:hypothetical protein|tara:strand:- start:4518 stop:6683 length:2166 start_codon:yes stop_codon:yes gene_type:complete